MLCSFTSFLQWSSIWLSSGHFINSWRNDLLYSQGTFHVVWESYGMVEFGDQSNSNNLFAKVKVSHCACTESLLCCLSLGIRLTPISLSLPYSRLIVLFLPRITLWFHLSQTPWSPCDPYASPPPHVLLSSLLPISSVSYSSYLVYITNPFPYVLLILVLLIPFAYRSTLYHWLVTLAFCTI